MTRLHLRIRSEWPLRRLVSVALFVMLLSMGATIALTTSREFWVMVNLWAQSRAG